MELPLDLLAIRDPSPWRDWPITTTPRTTPPPGPVRFNTLGAIEDRRIAREADLAGREVWDPSPGR